MSIKRNQFQHSKYNNTILIQLLKDEIQTVRLLLAGITWHVIVEAHNSPKSMASQ